MAVYNERWTSIEHYIWVKITKSCEFVCLCVSVHACVCAYVSICVYVCMCVDVVSVVFIKCL